MRFGSASVRSKAVNDSVMAQLGSPTQRVNSVLVHSQPGQLSQHGSNPGQPISFRFGSNIVNAGNFRSALVKDRFLLVQVRFEVCSS
ncbi:hypothetical protein HanRHA438_Chr14g0636041 [Helianthus annuus]|nr:hypothetical protein HanRHA438_Chr14g0636041 [Helianthus annuus]